MKILMVFIVGLIGCLGVGFNHHAGAVVATYALEPTPASHTLRLTPIAVWETGRVVPPQFDANGNLYLLDGNRVIVVDSSLRQKIDEITMFDYYKDFPEPFGFNPQAFVVSPDGRFIIFAVNIFEGVLIRGARIYVWEKDVGITPIELDSHIGSFALLTNGNEHTFAYASRLATILLNLPSFIQETIAPYPSSFVTIGTDVIGFYSRWDKVIRGIYPENQHEYELILPDGFYGSELVFSPDGRWLASSAATLNIWAVANQIQIQLEPADSITASTFTPDGRWFITGDSSGNVWLWATPNFQLAAQQYTFSSGGHVDALVATDELLIVGTVGASRSDGYISFLRLPDLVEVASYKLESGSFRLNLSPDGQHLIITQPAQTIILRMDRD